MGQQILKGITITPKGPINLARFSSTLRNGTWPESFAFGGYIFNTNTEIGYSNQPTEIKVSIVLEAQNKLQTSAKFDIDEMCLRGDAGKGGEENLYDINLNGIIFTDFILYDYEISIESNTKILNITFKDYSIILDKIYIGLIKRQGNTHVHSANTLISFPVRCTDCLLDGNYSTDGYTTRDINYGSYVGINGKVYDNFAGLNTNNNIYLEWQKLFTATQNHIKFDLNGGYLLLGTEEVTEEVCGNLSPISYNFNQLLASLRFRGFSFEGVFPHAITDSDFVYKQNYIGTLREVLQQWCSDLGYDFYCEGKRFIGINLNRSIDISKISEIADPTTRFGSQFALNKNTAILSFKETNTLANSFRQSVITANNFARQTKTSTKNIKRYVGFLPIHPLDFNRPSLQTVDKRDIFEHLYPDYAWTNSFDPGSPDLNKTLYQLDNRLFSDVDACIALSNYDDELRDIYCQDGALYGETQEIRDSNFKALGMVPLIEVTGENEKSAAIDATFGQPGDEVSNFCRDTRYYKVYIGYYYSKVKEDIVNFEKDAAQNMYKFGLLSKGLLRHRPYMPLNITQDVSPTAGLYGEEGTSFIKIKHNYEPNAQQYYDLYEAPYKDLLLYSGLKNVGDYFPPEMYIGEISNDWGTTQESFKRDLTIKLDDACTDEFDQEPNAVNSDIDTPKKYQNWKFNLFKPKFSSDLSNNYYNFQIEINKLDNNDLQMDRTILRYYDIHYQESNTCSKLHILVLTDTRTHPNISIDFQPRGREFINPVVLQKYYQKQIDAYRRGLEYQTPSICDLSMLQEMCDNIISGQNLSFPQDPRFDCVLHTNDQNVFEEGFPSSYLSVPNSRGLEINIIKNPIRNNDTDKIQSLLQKADSDGQLYFFDLLDDNLIYQQQQASLTIIYPISVNADENIFYRGILTTDVEMQNRSPEINEMFGEPPNIQFNNSTAIKIINNQIDTELQPQLDPHSNKFLTYLTVITGNGQVLSTVKEYHSFINNLNKYQLTGNSKNIEIKLAGTPDFFGSFSSAISPVSGLTKFSINIGDEGATTSLSFSDRSPVLPKQESILNRLGPRIVGR